MAAIVARFRNSPLTQDVLNEYCNLHKIEPVMVGDFSDYKYQVEHDERMSKMYPLVLAEISKIRWIPEFAPVSVRKAAKEGNDMVRINIVKLFEEHEIPYRLVDTLGQEMGREVGQTITMAGTTAFNKALEVMLLVAQKEFGGEFNMKHAADYAIKVVEERKGKQK